MVKSAGIAGAGLIGRLLALELLREGWQVSIFDQDDTTGRKSCGFIAGGMLSPYSEAETIGDLVVELGHRSLELWPKILHSINAETCIQMLGSVIVSHAGDLHELERMRSVISHRFPDLFGELRITHDIGALEQGLSVCHGMYIPGEGCIDSMRLFSSLNSAIKNMGIQWFSNTRVAEMSPMNIVTADRAYVFDMVFDCRGVGAKNEIAGLRGVRGEGILLHAPEVEISRPVRMMHPRYSLYVVPRCGHKFMIGATEIESCDFSEVSVKSALEILSAAYSLHKGFAEARVIDMMSACRPAFFDNLPRIFVDSGIMRINGLYRYGYLSAPALVREVITLLNHGDTRYPRLCVERTNGVSH
ncbi:MAG: FAD-dependent oxidoreductase [Anaplasma sp.]